MSPRPARKPHAHVADDVPVPAHVSLWHDVLGEELTIAFLLRFGGAELRIPREPRVGSALVRLVGEERAALLAGRAHLLPVRVPLAKPWLAGVLARRGYPVAEVARRLHASDVSVRRWLRQSAVRQDGDQASLF